jgi:hypothetical protein
MQTRIQVPHGCIRTNHGQRDITLSGKCAAHRRTARCHTCTRTLMFKVENYGNDYEPHQTLRLSFPPQAEMTSIQVLQASQNISVIFSCSNKNIVKLLLTNVARLLRDFFVYWCFV